jgi:hypothetical protein
MAIAEGGTEMRRAGEQAKGRKRLQAGDHILRSSHVP